MRKLVTVVCLLALGCGGGGGEDDPPPEDTGPPDAGDRDTGPPDAGPPPPDDQPYKGPWVMQTETDRALVRWETRLPPTMVAVEVVPEAGGEARTFTGTSSTDELTFSYGEDLFLVELPDFAGTYHLHDVVVDGLSPGTCYLYTLVDYEAHGGRFCTMREPTDHEGTIELLVVGDTSPLLEQTQKVLAQTLGTEPHFVVHAGDLQYYDAIAETWQLWFRELAPMLEAGAFYPTIGNHEDEHEGEYEAYYARLFDLPSQDGTNSAYHFETGGVHFFSVNSEDDIGEYDADFSWLDEALTAAEAEEGHRFSVVFFHRPMYTLARHAPSMRIREALEPVIAAHDVPLVLQGHNHVYERFEVPTGDRTVTYVVSGGGGSARYDLNANVEEYPSEVPLRVAAEELHHGLLLEITSAGIHGEMVDVDGVVRDEFDIAAE